MEPRGTCRLVTLGCKVNQYETQLLREALAAAGYRDAAADEPADLCVVNTCTVTAEADAKGRQLVRRLHEGQPRAAIVVSGCYAARDPAALLRLPGVSKVISDKSRLWDELAEFGVQRPPAGIRRFDGHQRAFVKVQDGCLLNCSFCIIPRVRPILRSRPIGDIVGEVRHLLEEGYQEIVLTGIHLGHYGIDLSRGRPKSGWSRLWHLIDALEELPGDFRVRLSSLEAAEVRGDLVAALARSRRVCPHLHLCLQSGSDRILTLMRRRYRRASFLERCRRLRALWHEPAFTTDVIVGFPGETEADFAETCEVVREAGFCKVHIFPFSPRQGTPAAELPGRVPPPVVAERQRRLRQLEQELADAYCRRLIGQILDVLVEGPDSSRSGYAQGTSCRYVPVAFPGYSPHLRRRRIAVRIVSAEAGVLVGEPVGSPTGEVANSPSPPSQAGAWELAS
ncbi:MAG: tRNA (N(6)-L-threonylcarbamoyladenosine(37)-C(2))-methylthiotransferase MtaB [Gemmataceae bacterium]|nr:tRNA (N(6)-L-threonylcarbamoyladenosine(37)-C(2))-methylthiotransferase MtaB [Gemmataceae bacterium]MDW8264291.1 tRNA (N(6)-L-threonylcarbamoyladenosine(37)-C(2))-methylthiotransferase MtaB [Gemmataceae bacterium]